MRRALAAVLLIVTGCSVHAPPETIEAAEAEVMLMARDTAVVLGLDPDGIDYDPATTGRFCQLTDKEAAEISTRGISVEAEPDWESLRAHWEVQYADRIEILDLTPAADISGAYLRLHDRWVIEVSYGHPTSRMSLTVFSPCL